MALTYLSLHAHIIFATKNREPLIADSWKCDLHAYIGGIVRGLGAEPMAVGGVADHVHLLIGFKSTHALAEVMRHVKGGSSKWATIH